MSCVARPPILATTRRTISLSAFSSAPRSMSYSISVGQPFLVAAPEDAAAKPHHVKSKNGTTTHFQNLYPSGKKNFTQWTMPLKMIK